VAETPDAVVATRAYEHGTVITVGDRPVFVIFAADVDPLAGEALPSKAQEAAARLTTAFGEAGEWRSPSRLLPGVVVALAATVLYVLLIWGLARLDIRIAAAASRAAERRLKTVRGGDVMVAVRAPMLVQRLLTIVGVAVGLMLTYSWLAIVLRRFPYTRPWGESLRAGLFSTVGSAARGVVDYLPNLFVVLAIILLTRFAIRLVNFAFKTVEEGRLTMPGVHPETAQPTRRIAVALLWALALILAYEHIPGAQSDAFKGISVFIGLIISLGSSGVMNQLMSGMMVTYSRAVRVGDFVRIGDVEGTVVQLGSLSTKIRNPRNEEITIPNAVVASSAATNFSRHADTDGVFAPTTITINYSVPWRQVQALLLLAAERTAGIRRDRPPIVLQLSLGDFGVQYALLVCLEQPHRRVATLHGLHANIQDAFNEYGVQIMVPAYEGDPGEPKTVPPSKWYAAPAAMPSADTAPAASVTAGGARVRAEPM
jgi:small-conductance mechanosensitive channel